MKFTDISVVRDDAPEAPPEKKGSKAEKHKKVIDIMHITDEYGHTNKRKTTMRRSIALSLSADFTTTDYYHMFGCAIGVIIVFAGVFLAWKHTGLGEYFAVCGGGGIDCKCENASFPAFKSYVRYLCFMTSMYCFCIQVPVYAYNGAGLNFMICSVFLAYVCTWPAFVFGSLEVSACIFIIGTTFPISLNVLTYLVYGMEGVRHNKILSLWWVWTGVATLVETSLSYLDMKYYPFILPLVTSTLEFAWLWLANFDTTSTFQATSIAWAYTLSCIAGLRFNIYLSLSSWKDIGISLCIDSLCELLFKLHPPYMIYSGKELTTSHIYYSKVVLYAEYVPVLVFIALLATDFSPMGFLVETSADGCAGYPIIPEIRERYWSVLSMVFAEFFSDSVAWLVIRKYFKLENLVQPLKLDSWIQFLCFWGAAFFGCIAAMECGSIVLKQTIRGGII